MNSFSARSSRLAVRPERGAAWLRTLVGLAVLVMCLGASARLAHAVEPTPGGAASSSARPPAPSLLADLDPASLLSRALDAERELDGIQERVERTLDTRAAVDFVTKRSAQIEHDALLAYERVGTARRWSTVADVRYRYVTLKSQLDGYRVPLTKTSALVSKLRERVRTIRGTWDLARSTLLDRGAPDEVTSRAAAIVELAAKVEGSLDDSMARLTKVSANLDDLIRSVDEVLDATDQNATGIVRDYWERGPYPWQLFGRFPSPEAFASGIGARALFLGAGLTAFVVEHPLHLVVTLLTWALTSLWVRRLHKERQEQERISLLDPAASIRPLPHHTIHDHPLSAGALVATIVGFTGIETLPAAASVFLLGMSVIASANILLTQRREGAVEIGVLTLVLYALVVAELLLDDFDAITSLLLLPEALVVGYVAFRTVTRPVFRLAGAWAAAKALLGRAWFAITVVGLLGWLGGYEVIASVCIDGTTRTLMLTIAAQAVYTTVTAVLSAAIHSEFGKRSLAVRLHGSLIQSKLELFARYYLLYRWLLAMLGSYTLERDLGLALDEWLASPVKLGSIEFSVGSGLVLIVGMVLAVVVAKVLRFVLEIELLPRTGLRTGTTAAVGSGAYFIAVSAGVFLTIAAAGMQLDKLAIVVSALGVGIGFGLQNIVQNFVAGLILFFGRPINVGDVVEVKDLTGRVMNVGARASTIRTFQGAEVIVPNSFFIADQVINWTLSDETRRIDIDIGVAYGVDPERVIRLLTDAVKVHQHILANPAPSVLFMGFGDSALNYQVRVWTRRSDIWVDIKSELGIAMNRVLGEAGISIPFPQRDVYLHTVASEKPISRTPSTEPDSGSPTSDT